MRMVLLCFACVVLVSACKRGSADADAAATVAVKIVDLPRAESFENVVSVFSVEVLADGTLAANGVIVKDLGELSDRARAEAGKTPDLRAVIRADKATPYGRIIAVMDALKRGGIAKLAFAVDTGS